MIGRALPVPEARLVVIVAAVALPESNVAAAQAQRPFIGPLYERGPFGLFDAERGIKGIAVPGELRLGKARQPLSAGI